MNLNGVYEKKTPFTFHDSMNIPICPQVPLVNVYIANWKPWPIEFVDLPY